MQKEPITNQGYERLKAELDELKNTQRGVVAQEIKSARELGDLKENAEYHAAKEKQSMLEAHITKLEDLHARSQIVDPSTFAHERVSFGSSVTITDLDTDEEKTYTIVGAYEADASKEQISFYSPLARALMGKEEGDEVSLKQTSKELNYEIERIFYRNIQ